MGCRGGPAVGDALRRGLVAGLRVPMTPTDVARAAEHAVRASYGRLMAVLSAQTHDLAAAEDALADALEQALRSWPEAGVPANPEGWLVTVARNRLRDYFGSAAHRTTAPGGDAVLPARVAADVPAAVERGDEIPDRRLELLFVCGNPAIDATDRPPQPERERVVAGQRR